jgi:tape measure domain-containing protein
VTVTEFINKIGFKVKNEDVDKVNNTISGIKNTATRLLGAIGVGLSLTAINGLVEEYTRVNNQIRNATEALGDQKEIQQEIMAAAEATRTSYSNTANVVAMLVKGNSELFGNVDEAVKFNNAATMLFKSAGKTNEDISSLMEAINKSFQKGYIDSETISQLLERAPEAVQLLNKRLGTTSDQLEQMATDGAFSVQDLKAAFLDSASEIEAGFANVQYSVTDALTVIRSKWGLWLAQTNETLGITDSIGRFMVSAFNKVIGVLDRVRNSTIWLADKLGGTQNLFKLIGTVAAAAFGVMALPRLLGFLTVIQKINKALVLSRLKILGIIAVVAMIALLIQDFVAFMKGNDSLIGSLFDKAGIGAENARQAILMAWSTIKEFLLSAWGAIKQAAEVIFGALAAWWEENGEQVKESFSGIWDSIKALCIALWNALSRAAQAIFGALQRFWDTWGETIITIFSTIWNTLISLIRPFLNAMAAIIDFLASVFTGDWEGAWNAIKDLAASIWEIITNIISGALDIITSVWDTAVGIFASIFENIKNAVVEKVTGIKDAIVGGFQAAIDWITSLPEQALQWGKDIIQAIIDGITGAVDGITNAVAGVAGKIKSFLGFSKPDEGPLSDFDTYMPDMIDLMSKGITAGKEKVRKALEGITGEMSVIASANMVSGGTAATATGTNQISKSVVLNSNINNTFNGDQAIQQKAAGAMDRSARDVTSELARGLAYAR